MASTAALTGQVLEHSVTQTWRMGLACRFAVALPDGELDGRAST